MGGGVHQTYKKKRDRRWQNIGSTGERHQKKSHGGGENTKTAGKKETKGPIMGGIPSATQLQSRVWGVWEGGRREQLGLEKFYRDVQKFSHVEGRDLKMRHPF